VPLRPNPLLVWLFPLLLVGLGFVRVRVIVRVMVKVGVRLPEWVRIHYSIEMTNESGYLWNKQIIEVLQTLDRH
jgi:hypothetical protein